MNQQNNEKNSKSNGCKDDSKLKQSQPRNFLQGNDNTPQTIKLTTELYDNAVFQRLQGLGRVLESIFH